MPGRLGWSRGIRGPSKGSGSVGRPSNFPGTQPRRRVRSACPHDWCQDGDSHRVCRSVRLRTVAVLPESGERVIIRARKIEDQGVAFALAVCADVAPAAHGSLTIRQGGSSPDTGRSPASRGAERTSRCAGKAQFGQVRQGLARNPRTRAGASPRRPRTIPEASRHRRGDVSGRVMPFPARPPQRSTFSIGRASLSFLTPSSLTFVP